jgi:membrane protein DedA with SNARE-associated domain
MTFEAAWASTLAVVKANIDLAGPLVFVLGLAEGIPGLSLLVPSSALFLAIGGVHGTAGGTFWHLWLPATLGAMAGDVIAYMLGRWLGNDVTRLRLLSIPPRALAAGHAAFDRWGSLAVLAGKFTGFARPFIPVVAGILTMQTPLFIAASFVSSLAWAGAFLAPGYGLRFLID